MDFRPGKDGKLFVTRVWNDKEELLACIEPRDDTWELTFLAGNLQGRTRNYPRLSMAVERLKEFIPYSNEGIN